MLLSGQCPRSIASLRDACSAVLCMQRMNNTGLCTLLSITGLSTAVLSIVAEYPVHAAACCVVCRMHRLPTPRNNTKHSMLFLAIVSALHRCCNGHSKAQISTALLILLSLTTVCHMWFCHWSLQGRVHDNVLAIVQGSEHTTTSCLFVQGSGL